MSEPRPETEREWLEGLRYEDKFPEPRPDVAALVETVQEALRERGHFASPQPNVALAALAERVAEAEAALRDSSEPIMDATFRGRLLRHGLSNQEIAEFVDAVESRELRAAAALRSLRGNEV